MEERKASPPSLQLSAKAWAIYDSNTDQLLCGHLERERREIASLTKIMTAYTAICTIVRLDMNVLDSKVETSFDASMMAGTTADLAEGDVLSVWDMLHAMLLPSGNDAAYALAEYFGLLLMETGTKGADPILTFVSEMNRNAKILGLSNTTFASPHGLQNALNKSTAHDVAKLAAVCMKSPLFAEVVKKSKYTCLGLDMFGSQKMFMWVNTNKLLAKGFDGLKTGITPTAGPCLASSFRDGSFNLILVVLACKSPDHRWCEVMLMKDWAVARLSGKDGESKDPPESPKLA